MKKKFGLNNEIIYDRTRFVMHLNGMKWVGTPAAESPSNAELGTIANWNLVLATANRVGAVCIRTNGQAEGGACWTSRSRSAAKSGWRVVMTAARLHRAAVFHPCWGRQGLSAATS